MYMYMFVYIYIIYMYMCVCVCIESCVCMHAMQSSQLGAFTIIGSSTPSL